MIPSDSDSAQLTPASRTNVEGLCGAFLLLTLTAIASLQAAEPASLPAPWKHQDIGAIEVAGDAGFASGVFTVKGSQDIWGTNDVFHFVFQPFTGDGQIVARVTAVQNTYNHAKAGVMIRETLAAGSKHATVAVTPVDGVQFLHRQVTEEPTKSDKQGINKGVLPYWVKLVRQGNVFSGYESMDGKTWVLTGSETLALGDRVFIGLVASSHVKTVLNTSTLDQVSVQSAKPPAR